MNSTIFTNNNQNSLVNSDSPVLTDEREPSKKRKLFSDENSSSGIQEAEGLEAENEKLKKQVKNSATKIKMLEDQKQEFVKQIKELYEENLLMKTIKSEIKESVEEEKGTATIDKLKAEIHGLKEHNYQLEQKIEETKLLLFVEIKTSNKFKKNLDKANSVNRNLKEENEFLKGRIETKEQENQEEISSITTLYNRLRKKNNVLVKNRRILRRNIAKYKAKIESLKDETKLRNFSLPDIFDGSMHNLQLLSCETKKVLNFAKIEGVPSGWNLYSTMDKTEKPRFIAEDEFAKTCFKLNITGEIIAPKSDNKICRVLHRIYSCELTKLHISGQKISFADYAKLVASEKFQICILKKVQVEDDLKKYDIDDLLTKIPNIKIFQYEFLDNEDLSDTAKKLSKLQKFPNLKSFQLSNLSSSFKLEAFEGFIKKNKTNVCYEVKFSNLKFKYLQKEIEKAERTLLKSLMFPCNLSVETNLSKPSILPYPSFKFL